MKKIFTYLAAALMAMPMAAQQKTYKNPVYGSDFPDPTVQRAKDGTFYSYATGCKCKKSTNLVTWENVSGVISRPTWNDSTYVDADGNSKKDNYSLWAADVSYVDGKYVCYYASALWGNGTRTGIGVAVGDTPTKFTDRGKVFRSTEIGVKNSIDPCYVEEFDKKYLVWGSFHDICMVELTDDALAVKDFSPLSQPSSGSWTRHKGVVKLAGGAFEGAMIYKRDKYYYLFCSVGSCCEGENSTYRTVVGRATNLTGPYVNKQGGSMVNNNYTTIISGNDRWKGPGHNSEIITDDNGDDWLLYHSYDKNNGCSGRLMLLDKITWTSDGWPVINDGHPSSDEMPAPVFYTGNGANLTYKFDNMDLMFSGWRNWKQKVEGCTATSGQGTAFMPFGTVKGEGTFDINQTVSGVKDGLYEINLQNFSVMGGVDIYVNDVATKALVPSEMGKTAPTSSATISSNFQRGTYLQKAYGLVIGGKLTIGMRSRGTLSADERYQAADIKVIYREKDATALNAVLDFYNNKADEVAQQGGRFYKGYTASLAQYKQTIDGSTDDNERYSTLLKVSKTLDSLSNSVEIYSKLNDELTILANDVTKAIAGNYVSAEAQQVLEEAQKVYAECSYTDAKVNDLVKRMQQVNHDMRYAYQQGDGTQTNPYIISRPDQLDNMRNVLVKEQMVYFKMDADVDMAGYNWQQLNTSDNSNRYWINFDGQGHIIRNLTPDGSKNYPSFFGVMCGECRNVGFVDAKVEAAASGAGVICGYMGHSTFKDAEGNMLPVIVENCYFTGEIISKGYVGTIGGTLNNSPITIRNCYSAVKVTGNGGSANYSGGLVGRVRTNLTIENCYAAGAVDSPVAGGVVAGGQSSTTPASYYTNVLAWLPSVKGTTVQGFGTIVEGDVLSNVYLWDKMLVNDEPVSGDNLRSHEQLQQLVAAWGTPWYSDPAAGNGYPILQWQYERGDYKQICGFEDNGSTGIVDVTTDNGHQTTDNAIFNLNGQRILKPQHGIYVIGGRKVFVK